MRYSVLWIVASFLCGCASAESKPGAIRSSDNAPIIITLATDRRELKAAAEKWVRVEGVVSDDKTPEIAGIGVEVPPGLSLHALWGKRAWAEGILTSEVVREEDVDDSVQNRGAGTFFHLRDRDTGKPAVLHLTGADP